MKLTLSFTQTKPQVINSNINQSNIALCLPKTSLHLPPSATAVVSETWPRLYTLQDYIWRFKPCFEDLAGLGVQARVLGGSLAAHKGHWLQWEADSHGWQSLGSSQADLQNSSQWKKLNPPQASHAFKRKQIL